MDVEKDDPGLWKRGHKSTNYKKKILVIMLKCKYANCTQCIIKLYSFLIESHRVLLCRLFYRWRRQASMLRVAMRHISVTGG